MWTFNSSRIHFHSSPVPNVIFTSNVKKVLRVLVRRTVDLCEDCMNGIPCRFVRNSPLALSLFKRAWQLYQENRDMRHQVAISTAIDEFLLRGLKMHLMSIREFAPGWMFFEEMHYVTQDDLPCDDCVMFHNNWVMTASAKVYRMKELGLYRTSSDYYTNPESLFITYDPLPESATIGAFLLSI